MWVIFLVVFLPLQRTKRVFFNASVMFTGLACVFIVAIVFLCIPHTFKHYSTFLLSSNPVNMNGTLVETGERVSFSFDFGNGDWTGILSALPYACWAYVGIEMISITAEEAHNSEVTAPRASMNGMALLTILSWGLLLVVPGVFPGSAVLASSVEPLIDALIPNMGLKGDVIATTSIRLLGMLGFIATLHTGTYSLSRLIYALSRGGHLPAFLSITEAPFQKSKHPGVRAVGTFLCPEPAPVRSIIFGTVFVYCLSIVIWCLGKESKASDLFLKATVFITLFCYLGEFLSFVVLRFTLPGLPRPFRNPTGVVGGVVGSILCAFVIVSCLIVDENFRVAGLMTSVMMTLIVPYYLLYARQRLLVTPEKAFIKKHLNFKFQQRVSYLPSSGSSPSSASSMFPPSPTSSQSPRRGLPYL
jgi:amino acid transporter